MDNFQKLQVGDEVIIYYERDGERDEMKGILQHTPGGPGDLFQALIDGHTLIAINPYHSSFLYMLRVEPEELDVPF